MTTGHSSAVLPGNMNYILSAPSPENVTPNLHLNNEGENCVIFPLMIKSCPAARGIFQNLESNPHPLHWKEDS